MKLRILWTSSRELTDLELVRSAIVKAGRDARVHPQETIVVQGNARGGDQLARRIAREFGCHVEDHDARDHSSPLARNAHMVGLGADVCLAAALAWASGTGNCARLARAAGIPTIDYGVDTRAESRPVTEATRQLDAMAAEAAQLGLYEQTAEPKPTR